MPLPISGGAEAVVVAGGGRSGPEVEVEVSRRGKLILRRTSLWPGPGPGLVEGVTETAVCPGGQQ